MSLQVHCTPVQANETTEEVGYSSWVCGLQHSNYSTVTVADRQAKSVTCHLIADIPGSCTQYGICYLLLYMDQKQQAQRAKSNVFYGSTARGCLASYLLGEALLPSRDSPRKSGFWVFGQFYKKNLST